jgi:hypothetical protein
MKKLIIIAAAAAAAVVTAVVPFAAFAAFADGDGEDSAATIGVRLDFSTATQADGSFAVCCTVTDSGPAHAEVTSYVERGDRARFEATNTFTGEEGTFTILLRGTTGPLGSPVHLARGGWRVIEGSGAYARLEGKGRFTAVTNQATGALTAIDEGELELEDADEDD